MIYIICAYDLHHMFWLFFKLFETYDARHVLNDSLMGAYRI